MGESRCRCGALFPGKVIIASSVGEKAKSLGAYPLMAGTGGVLYLCVPCAARLAELCRGIQKIVGETRFSVGAVASRYPTNENPTGWTSDG